MSAQSGRLVRNYLLLTGGELASKIVTFAAMAYLARVASPVGYGQIEFAAAIILCAGLIVDQGFNIYGAREIAKNPEHSNALASEIGFVRFLLAFVAYFGVAIFAFSLDRPPAVTQLILIYGLSLFGMPLLMYWVFQGHNWMGMAALIQALRQFVFAGVVFGFIRTSDQIWIAGLAETAGVFCAGLFSVWAVRHFYAWRVLARPRLTRRLLTDGIPIGLSQIFWMVRMYGATVIIGVIAVPADVGYFGSAMRILIALHAFVYLYYFNLLPTLSQAWQRQDGSFRALSANSYRLVAWAAVLIGCVWVILAPWVMIVVYGAAFAPGGLILQILAGVFILAALDGHYRYGLIAAGFQKSEMLAALLGAVVALIAVPLGYRLSGVAGSALGLVLAQVVVWLTTWRFAQQKTGMVGHLAILARPALGLAATAAIVWLIPVSNPIFQAVLASTILVALAIAMDAPLRRQVRELLITGPFGNSLHSKL
jgi:O-antigen/teichoic acid export membrane protein